MKIAVLGSSGMLGSMMNRVLQPDITFNRPQFDAERPFLWLDGYQVVNCIGVIKPYCEDVERAIKVNALFPHTLPVTTIQIATDCVFSGNVPHRYLESDPHDALDTYGKTKSLGEASHIKNLRCSIIGPEVKNHTSLLDWFLRQDKVDGYTNHYWNGITTYHFAKIVQGAIRESIELPQIQHIVPADITTKAQLLRLIARAYNKDIAIHSIQAHRTVYRILGTNNYELNLRLWQAAGYESPPTIKQMVNELASL